MWPLDKLLSTKPRVADLLAALLPLSNHERVQRVVALGQRAGGDPRAAQLLAALAEGDAYQRRLALKACYRSRDGAMVLRLINDESRLVRGAARKLVALCCDDDQALRALQECFPVRQHLPILKGLSARGRTAPIDGFLDWLSQQHADSALTDTLPFGSAACVLRHFAAAQRRPSPVLWLRLLSLQPERVADMLEQRTAALPAGGHPDSELRWLLNLLLLGLAGALPERALAVCAALCSRGVPLPSEVLTALIQRIPGPAFDLYLQHQQRLGGASFERVVPRLGLPRILQALAHNPLLLGAPDLWFKGLDAEEREAVLRAWLAILPQHPGYGEVLIRHLDPTRHAAERERTFQGWREARQDAEGVIGLAALQRLPQDLQRREARRHLEAVPALATRPAVRLRYCSLLPWAEAAAVLQLYIGHPEGEVRGGAVALLLTIAGQEPERVPEALRMVQARKNEQDPVRQAMLHALNSWPRPVWQAEHLPAVAQIVRDALDAADLSNTSAQAAELLVLRTFHLDGAAGARWLATLMKERGTIYNPRLGTFLTDEDVRCGGASLLAVARAWAAREREPQLIAFCQSLGARIGLVAGLCDLIIEVIERAPVGYGAGHAALPLLCLLSEHARPSFLQVLPRIGAVWFGRGWYGQLIALAQRQRQSDGLPDDLLALLERALAATHNEHEASTALVEIRRLRRPRFESLLGELLARDRSFVMLPLIYQHLEWRRQDLLTPFLQDEKMKGRFATGKTRWILPFRRGFLRWSPAQHDLYAAALDALVQDQERDTPTIFWAVDRLVGLAYTDAGRVLRLASDGRAAIQEKGIRALSRLDASQGVPTLLSCLDDARARIAVYAFRRAVMELPPTRGLQLLQAVPLRKVTVAKEVLRILGELRSEGAYRFLLTLDQPTLHRDIRIALLRSLWDHLERAETWEVYARAAQDRDWLLSLKLAEIPAERLTSYSEPRLSALLARVLEREEPEARIDLLQRAAHLPIRDGERPFLRACLRLWASRYPDERAAATDAALVRATETDVALLAARFAEIAPQRQALATCLGQLTSALARRSSVHEALAQGVLGALRPDPLLTPQVLRLAAALRPTDGPGLVELLGALVKEGRLHAAALEAARSALVGLTLNALQRAALQRSLAAHADERLRWLSLAVLVASAAAGQGWSQERRDRLQRLQADPSPLVAGAAQQVFPPEAAAG